MSTLTQDDLTTRYLRGEALYGDTLVGPDLERWFTEEAEGYANLGAKDRSTYVYAYHALNWYHGFRHLPRRRFRTVLGFGGAYGDELGPVAHQADRIVIVDPSDAFAHTDLRGVPLTYVKPVPSGTLPFPSETFDLITCTDVLHHIPNVSYVLRELARVLAPGGYFLLREPIHSMGDWRRPRAGLTKNERGIPIRLLRAMIAEAGLAIEREAPCVSRLVQVYVLRLGIQPYNSQLVTRIDAWYSRLFGFRRPYHATRWFHRLCPIGAAYVLRKPVAH
jgi:SAM-dependent methyltransferase